MEFKIIKYIAILALMEIVCLNVVKADMNADLTPADKKVVKQIPIVIKTPERNFDEPNMADFEKCSKDFDSCQRSCEDVSQKEDTEECIKKCPKCPILVIQDAVVQGINDTDLRAMKPNIVNATNIIKLTNEIHNVIENRLGNITAHNENNVHIHSKNSTIGGKFGMGYTEHGPCCMVVRNRDHKQRLCGQRCKARVMQARSVVQCADEMDIDSCKQVMEYKPYRRSRHESVAPTYNRCSYQEEWPFVYCRNRRQQYDYCSPQCIELAYSYILRYGVPLHCVNCFKNFAKSGLNAPPLGYLPPTIPDDDADNEFIDEGEDGNGWTLQKSKCRKPDGTISEDCDNELGSGEDGFIFSDDDTGYAYDRVAERDRKFIDDTFDIPRRRRNSFHRSKYSKRHGKHSNSRD